MTMKGAKQWAQIIGVGLGSLAIIVGAIWFKYWLNAKTIAKGVEIMNGGG